MPHKLQPGTSVSVRNLPSPVNTKEREIEVPDRFLEYAMARLERHMASVNEYITALSRVTEESTADSATAQETTLSTRAEYSPASARITSILVTGPVSTAFTLQLGGDTLSLSTDVNGKCLLAPVVFTLAPRDPRTLTSDTAGAWYLRLSGYALGIVR